MGGTNGEKQSWTTPLDLSKENKSACLSDLRIRNPDTFKAGQIHNHIREWEAACLIQPNHIEVGDWVNNKVSIWKYMKHFKGEFANEFFDSDEPPTKIFPNNQSCRDFHEFVSKSIEDRIASGAVGIIGPIHECPPPHLVMPLTVEPGKPRLCHDERFLNLWMKDMPFRLDSLIDVPRYMEIGHYQTKLDDKSGYDHVLLSQESRSLVGFQWGGWWFVNNVLPFGWKISPYIYQTLGLAATQKIRDHGVPCCQYIDDRHLGQLRRPQASTGDHSQPHDNVQLARDALYIAVNLLTSLGYFLNVSKSCFVPTQSLIYLGMRCDSSVGAFFLPLSKKEKFAVLREDILRRKAIPLVLLQKLVGKCISFTLAVPGAKLFTNEMNMAIAQASKRKGFIKIVGPLRAEIEYWRFLDSWNGSMKWLDERHCTIQVASDSSGYKWGGVLFQSDRNSTVEVGDFWKAEELLQPIHVKEMYALCRCLLTLKARLQGKRVDAKVDNKALVDCWNRQHSRTQSVLLALKELFWITVDLNISLHVHLVASKENPADAPSRSWSFWDCMLSRACWMKVQRLLGGAGGHTIDLLSLDSNVQGDFQGHALPHFAPVPTPACLGVNVFAQCITYAPGSVFESCYAFPPLPLVGAVLRFLKQEKARCTLVVPDVSPKRYWWPILVSECAKQVCLACRGDSDVLLCPSPQGFIEFGPIPWDLYAFRLCYV